MVQFMYPDRDLTQVLFLRVQPVTRHTHKHTLRLTHNLTVPLPLITSFGAKIRSRRDPPCRFPPVQQGRSRSPFPQPIGRIIMRTNIIACIPHQTLLIPLTPLRGRYCYCLRISQVETEPERTEGTCPSHTAGRWTQSHVDSSHLGFLKLVSTILPL